MNKVNDIFVRLLEEGGHLEKPCSQIDRIELKINAIMEYLNNES